MTVQVDGKAINPADTLAYKGMMYSDVPNFAVVSGYTNASWTLKADLVCEYVCRLLNHMQKQRPAPVHAAATTIPTWSACRGSTSRRATSSAPPTQFPKQGAQPALAIAPELREGPLEPALRIVARQGHRFLALGSPKRHAACVG